MGPGPQRSILVVDDSPTAVMHLSLLLKRMGYRVIAARNGVEALAIVCEQCPDAVLLDLHMPVMDGITFLRELRGRTEFATTPVVVVTVDADPGVRERCVGLGCNGFLQKPVGLKELHDEVESCLRPTSAKRGHLRTAFGKTVSVAALGRTSDYFAVSLSEAGIYIRMAEPLPSGTETAVTLPLDNGQPLTLQGKVIYDKGIYGAEMKIDPGVAIVFSDLTPEQSFHLTTLVRRQLVANLFEEIGMPVLDLDDKAR